MSDRTADSPARRGRLRTVAAVSVLVVWAGALAWHAKRLYLQPEAERLTAAARTIPPGVAYYAIHQGDRQIGWAQSELDTLPDDGGFLIRDRMTLDLDALGMPGRAQLRSRAMLGAALDLRRFVVRAEGLPAAISAQGWMDGDSVLQLTVRRGETVTARRVPLEGHMILGTALPLRLAAERQSRPGDRYTVRTFDPVGMRPTTRTVEIEGREMRSYPDSAVYDEASESWKPGRRDTLLAWKLDREVAGRPVEVWLGSDGRYLEVATEGGFRLERTAFEVAYYGFGGEPGGDVEEEAR